MLWLRSTWRCFKERLVLMRRRVGAPRIGEFSWLSRVCSQVSVPPSRDTVTSAAFERLYKPFPYRSPKQSNEKHLADRFSEPPAERRATPRFPSFHFVLFLVTSFLCLVFATTFLFDHWPTHVVLVSSIGEYMLFEVRETFTAVVQWTVHACLQINEREKEPETLVSSSRRKRYSRRTTSLLWLRQIQLFWFTVGCDVTAKREVFPIIVFTLFNLLSFYFVVFCFTLCHFSLF